MLIGALLGIEGPIALTPPRRQDGAVALTVILNCGCFISMSADDTSTKIARYWCGCGVILTDLGPAPAEVIAAMASLDIGDFAEVVEHHHYIPEEDLEEDEGFTHLMAAAERLRSEEGAS